MSAPAAPPAPPAPPTPLAPPTADGIRLFQNDDVARLLNIAPQSLRVRRMRDDGGGPPYIRLAGPSSRALYPEADLHAWLSSRPRYTSTSAEKAALYAKVQAAKPRQTRRRLANRRVDFVSPPVGSKPTPTRPTRSGAKARKKS